MSGAVTYTDKGHELLDSIADAGHWVVPDGNGGYIADDPTTVQPIINNFVGTQQKLRDLATAFSQKITAGRLVTVQGVQKNYQIDDGSRANIAAAGSLAASILANTPGAGAWNSAFYWIAADNSHQAMSAADCYAFAQNVAAYYTALVTVNRAFKDAINIATTQAALDSIDLTANWPANP